MLAPRARRQAAVGAGVLALAVLLGAGAMQVRGEAGYGGVGPAFLPWLVCALLAGCGVLLVREALTGGFRAVDEPVADEPTCWPGMAWVSAGMLANAALITQLGFVLSCALCYALSVHGFKLAEGRAARGVAGWVRDAALGAAIAAPVYWMFTKALAINLPGLSATGWF